MKIKLLVIITLIIPILLFSCQNEQQVEFDRYYTAGNVIYQSRCQNCHGEKGEGLNGLIPPLTDSTYLKTNKAALACSIKFGLKGKITVVNKEFEGEMPANDLAPVEIAEVLTYVSNSFGNKTGTITLDMANKYLAGCR